MTARAKINQREKIKLMILSFKMTKGQSGSSRILFKFLCSMELSNEDNL